MVAQTQTERMKLLVLIGALLIAGVQGGTSSTLNVIVSTQPSLPDFQNSCTSFVRHVRHTRVLLYL